MGETEVTADLTPTTDAIDDLLEQHADAAAAFQTDDTQQSLDRRMSAADRIRDLLAERDATIAQLSVDRDRAVARIGVLDERVTTWKTRLVDETESLRGYLAEAREQVAQLTAERDAMRQALEALANHAYSHRDELTDLLDNDAVRLATGETCVLGMPMTCADAHSAGHCVKPRDEASGTTAGGDNRG